MRLRRRMAPGAAVQGPRLKARRGALVLMLGVFFSSTVVLGALTFDLARLANFKAELQNAADAAAHAGVSRMAAQCLAFPDYQQIDLVARNVAASNQVMYSTPIVESVVIGAWDGVATVTDTGTCQVTTDAVRVELSRQTSGLFMSLLGVSAPNVRAAAISYACPQTGGLITCPLPWPSNSGFARRPILVR